MEGTRARVRLKFQEPDILTSEQIEQGLAQSWFLVLLEEVHTIADVAFDIRAAFHLEKSCPNGLSLEVEGFVLPSSQPASLLKESDLIRVRRRTGIQGQLSHGARNKHVHIQDEEWMANSPQRINGYHGVELRAVDEFEKEAGGYESEQEEGEMETDFSLDGTLRHFAENNPSPARKKRKDKDSSGKTHKRSKDVASEVGKVTQIKDPGGGQELAIVQAKDKSNSVINCGMSKSFGGIFPLDELEKGTGTNRMEENGVLTDILGERRRSRKKKEAVIESALHKQEKIEKKRKRKEVNMEGQSKVLEIGEEGLSTSDMQLTVGDRKNGEQKVKRKKLNHSGADAVATFTPIETMDQVQVKIVEANGEDVPGKDIKRSEKKNKSKDVNGLNNENDMKRGMLTKGAAVDEVETKKRKKARLESSLERQRTPEIKATEGSISARTPERKVDGESTIARTLKNETNAPIQEQRPSRSARRKKAKRRWLREQAKVALLVNGVETRDYGSKGSKVHVGQQVLDTSPISDEVVVEAEEEVLPVVVRAGHIRFEPYDIGERQDQCRVSTPAILFGDQVKTKRQGQNWGQEKSSEKYKDNRLQRDADLSESPQDLGDEKLSRTELHIDPEKHPALDGAPQKGDVLAYRLVELTASWTPEISPYRVGIVAHWEHSSHTVIMDPHPDYPRLGKKASAEDEEELWNVDEMQVQGPYDENGVLEIEFSSLVDVRLMQRVAAEKHKVGGCPSVRIGKEWDLTTAVAHRPDSPPCEPFTDIRDSIPTGEQQGVEDGERAECTSALHALLSEELERKKTELCQRDLVVTDASIGVIAPSEHLEKITVGNEGGKLLTQPKAGRDRKHKFLRSAGVGSIVALLRAQQAL